MLAEVKIKHWVTNFQQMTLILIENDMRQKEVYKGIEFVRISNLPNAQRERIVDGFPKEKIILILQDVELLRDCILYQDYQEWFTKTFQQQDEIYRGLNNTTMPLYQMAIK